MKKNRLENPLDKNDDGKRAQGAHIHIITTTTTKMVYVCKHFKTETTSSVYKRLNQNQLQIKTYIQPFIG